MSDARMTATSAPRWRDAALLAALLATALLGVQWLHETLTDRQQQQREILQRQQLVALLPGPRFEGARIVASIPIAAKALGHRAPRSAWLLRNPDGDAALLLPVISDAGYNGPIELLLALAPDGTLVGLRSLEHDETPGLGDAIDRQGRGSWMHRFIGRQMLAPDVPSRRWQLRSEGGEVDAISGATITSRAVLHALDDAAIWFQRDGRAVLARLQSSATGASTP